MLFSIIVEEVKFLAKLVVGINKCNNIYRERKRFRNTGISHNRYKASKAYVPLMQIYEEIFSL